jgi:predicted esterase
MNSFLSDHHQGLAILQRGQPMEKAKAAMLLLHGRGASAESMLSLADEIPHPDFVYLALQAEGNSWYPYSFLAPLEHNEPWLSSALAAVGAAMDILSNHGLPGEKVILLGFSQGACLAVEYAARNARRYGGVVGLSGGLIGPPGTPRNYVGTLDSTPIFLGCSNIDPHIPEERVRESEWIFVNLGAEVTTRFYPNMGHAVNQDEIEFVQQMMAELVQK